jgi:tight adherence protein B
VNPILLGIVVFVGVAAIVGGVALFLQDKPASKIENRLNVLTGISSPAAKEALAKEATILSQPLNDRPGIFQLFLERFGNIDLFLEQADTNLSVTKLLGISAILTVLGVAVGVILHIHIAIIPVMGVFMAMLPLIWVMFRRSRRLKAFAAQLPDALEMLSRGLRSGQSMVFGFSMVANEMPTPISKEFGRVFEEQNLGISLEESLRGMANRIPNLDLKFFVTAVVLQRQTGGDLAEILDKIGSLIRDRFRIWGQIQALTGEGRLSGVILLGLPFVLFLAVYQLNPAYLMTLFTDPLGKQMLGIAVFMQILGALCIRKIVNIKV